MAMMPRMSYRPVLALGIASLTACATAAGGEGSDAQGGGDSSTPSDAGVDARPQPDANCGTIEVELLTNPAFDAGLPPWVEKRIDPAYGIIVGTGGVAALTAPNKAWLGGFAKAAPNDDQLHQDVPVPANASSLTLTGSYWVGTNETLSFAFDIGSVDLANTANNSMENVLALDNRNATTAWTPFSKTFTNVYAGQTIRILMKSSGDSNNVTNFFFDSLSLKATVPQTVCP
jgi:hypothetical protein